MISVKVSAFPAVELLWHHADSVTVALGAYRSSPSHLADLLHQASGVDTVTASATELSTGRLTLRDATLHKHGNELTGIAQVSEASIRRALPVLKSVTPVASSNGQLTVRGTGSLFGVTATVDATVSAQNGAVVVAPDVPLGGLATITVFSNPRRGGSEHRRVRHREQLRGQREREPAVTGSSRARNSTVSFHARSAASRRKNMSESWLSNAWPPSGWMWFSQFGSLLRGGPDLLGLDERDVVVAGAPVKEHRAGDLVGLAERVGNR